MRQFLDFLPILVFVGVFFATDVYWATGALMAAVAIQLGAYKVLRRPIGRELMLTFLVSILFGGLTIVLRNETFIQWKPTVVNWMLAAALLGSHFMGRNLMEKLLGGRLRLPGAVWRQLNFGWSAGFFLAGALNLVVAYGFSMEFWVTYKLVGGLLLTFSYIALTFAYLHRLGLLALPAEAGGRKETKA